MTEFPTLGSLIDLGHSLQPDNDWPTYTGNFLDRKKCVSASECGNCPRRIKFGKVHPRPSKLVRWGFAERGSLIESWIIVLVREALKRQHPNWSIMFAGENQFSFVDEPQSGTPDGLFVHKPSLVAKAIEIKSIDPRTNVSNLPKKKHVKQLQQNMDLLERQTPYHIIGGVVFYIDASDLQRRFSFDIEVDREVQTALTTKARKIMEAPSPAHLEPEGMFMDKECDECDYNEECSALIRASKNGGVDPMKDYERAMKDVFK